MLLGLDIGGTKSAAVAGDNSGVVLARAAGPTPQGDWQDAVAFLVSLVREVCQQQGVRSQDMDALGVSCGGPLDTKTGVILSPPNLPGWDAVPLRAVLEAELGLPVAIENDANATALAEWTWGAGQGTTEMAFLTVGTGIGAGLILGGRLYRGRRDLAGEIGHATIYPDGPLCPCGKRGCLETLASGGAIGRMGRAQWGDEAASGAAVVALARAGDERARAILDGAGRALGIGLANLLQTLNLERIVLGTLAVHAGDLLLSPTLAALEAYAWPSVREGVSVVPALLGDAAQDRAALRVAMEATQTPSPS